MSTDPRLKGQRDRIKKNPYAQPPIEIPNRAERRKMEKKSIKKPGVAIRRGLKEMAQNAKTYGAETFGLRIERNSDKDKKTWKEIQDAVAWIDSLSEVRVGLALAPQGKENSNMAKETPPKRSIEDASWGLLANGRQGDMYAEVMDKRDGTEAILLLEPPGQEQIEVNIFPPEPKAIEKFVDDLIGALQQVKAGLKD